MMMTVPSATDCVLSDAVPERIQGASDEGRVALLLGLPDGGGPGDHEAAGPSLRFAFRVRIAERELRLGLGVGLRTTKVQNDLVVTHVRLATITRGEVV